MQNGWCRLLPLHEHAWRRAGPTGGGTCGPRPCATDTCPATHAHLPLALIPGGRPASIPACLPAGVLQDVAWHCHHADIFGSVGDDKQLILWDVRRPPDQGEWGSHGHEHKRPCTCHPRRHRSARGSQPGAACMQWRPVRSAERGGAGQMGACLTHQRPLRCAARGLRAPWGTVG